MRLFENYKWEELARRSDYSAGRLARLCKVSCRHLEREFQRNLGRSPKAWLEERRMLAAREMLLSGESVKVVSLELGFKQASHFCRRFKQTQRMTPTQFIFQQGCHNPECPTK